MVMQRKQFQKVRITFLKIQSLTMSLKRRISISQLRNVKDKYTIYIIHNNIKHNIHATSANNTYAIHTQ